MNIGFLLPVLVIVSILFISAIIAFMMFREEILSFVVDWNRNVSDPLKPWRFKTIYKLSPKSVKEAIEAMILVDFATGGTEEYIRVLTQNIAKTKLFKTTDILPFFKSWIWSF